MQGPVYIRSTHQWVLGVLSVIRERVSFTAVDPFSHLTMDFRLAAVKRCRVLPCTAAGHDVGVFEVCVRHTELTEEWPALGTRPGTVWFKAADTAAAVAWAEAIDDGAFVATERACGRDTTWWPAVETTQSTVESPSTAKASPSRSQPHTLRPTSDLVARFIATAGDARLA